MLLWSMDVAKRIKYLIAPCTLILSDLVNSMLTVKLTSSLACIFSWCEKFTYVVYKFSNVSNFLPFQMCDFWGNCTFEKLLFLSWLIEVHFHHITYWVQHAYSRNTRCAEIHSYTSARQQCEYCNKYNHLLIMYAVWNRSHTVSFPVCLLFL